MGRIRMVSDTANLHRLYSETHMRLDRYTRLVNEGKELMAALDFTRYLIWSGVIQILEQNAQDGPLKVDGSLIRWKCEELQRLVHDRFRSNDTAPHMATAELETLHDKLDKIAGYLSKLSVAPAVAVSAHDCSLSASGQVHN